MKFRERKQIEIDYGVAVEDREGLVAEKFAQPGQRTAGAQQRRSGA